MKSDAPKNASNFVEESVMSTDPVCGMEVYENMAPAKADHQGVTYYFCSQACWGAFQDDPSEYVDAAERQFSHVA